MARAALTALAILWCACDHDGLAGGDSDSSIVSEDLAAGVDPLPDLAMALPVCDDGVRNAAESDVDCGGPLCGPCGNGGACVVGADCRSGFCLAGVCAD